jgi:hypothetical protein
VQEVGKGANLSRRFFCQLTTLGKQLLGFQSVVCGNNLYNSLKPYNQGAQNLRRAVVQFAGKPASFFVSQAKQVAREVSQRLFGLPPLADFILELSVCRLQFRRALLDPRFQFFVCLA